MPIGPKVSFKKPITSPEDQTEDKSGEKSGDESEKSGDEASDGEQGENKDGQEGDEILTYKDIGASIGYVDQAGGICAIFDFICFPYKTGMSLILNYLWSGHF